MSDIDKVQSLEVKFANLEGHNRATAKWQAIFMALIVSALGYTSIYQIPNEAKSVIKQAGADAIVDRLETLQGEAEIDAKKISDALTATKQGRINIGGECFEPRTIWRCWHNGDRNHMTWIGSDKDCVDGNYEKDRKMYVLAQCK